ncbi:tail assembly chaperone [Arthrobacter phage Lilmac1015]|uniref:Tail assembly chaperone n=2 Tax=Lilmacvirus TaxID=3425005 RepID=A0AAE9BRN8_9CAUD|nr:tail assembly chaperone [Arthrobacter phage Klevey]UKH48303.1 tail assembly chaperone [Arthrobacter phage Lilmac1015]
MTETFGGYDALDETKIETRDSDGAELSLLEELEAELDAEITNVVRFAVPNRPGWVLEFNAVIGAPAIKRYNATATGKGKPENADGRISNGMALLETNTGILKERNGELVRLTDPDTGGDLKLNSTRWLKMMKEPTTNPNAVRALCRFMDDSGVIAMGGSVLRAAGWAEDLTPLDPTDG